MRLSLDHHSPVPLYHQLAESIRYRIATGELKPGEVLPPLRRAAKAWGVNLHTVRRAYAELAESGAVRTSAPLGTRILHGGRTPAAGLVPAARQAFIESVVREARLRHGLALEDLIGLLRKMKPAESRRSVSVVECSRTQCEDLSGQIEARWRVSAVPWPLDSREPPPGGLVVATYFHYNDVRRLWPSRLADVHFMAISPEMELGERLRRSLGRSRGRMTVVFLEKDDAMARNIASDLARLLPAKEFKVVTEVVPRPEAGLRERSPGTPILLSPRMWGELPDRARRDPRLHQVRYVFDARELDLLGAEQGWDPA
jgi:GntR family transcriptional regulator